jgi:hypothetical protein
VRDEVLRILGAPYRSYILNQKGANDVRSGRFRDRNE